MENIVLEKLRRIVAIFKLKATLSEVFINQRGDYQFTADKEFKTKVTREDAEKAAESIPKEEQPVSDPTSPAAGVHEIAAELVETKNLLADEQKRHEQTTAKLNEKISEIGELIEGENPEELAPRAESWIAERRNHVSEAETLRKIIEAQESDLTANAQKIAEYEKKITDLEKKLKGK